VADKPYAIIIASPRARTGKTLLARLFVDYFQLNGISHTVFDTDPVERKLASFFPDKTIVVDLDRVTDQMKLFDTSGGPVHAHQVIDLTHRSFRKFFALVRDIDFIAEARASGLEPLIVFIPEGDADSYEQGAALRAQFPDCGFVLVHNEVLGEPSRDILRKDHLAAFLSQVMRMALPRLDPFFLSAIADPKLSLSEFMRRSLSRELPSRLAPEQMSLAYLSREARSGISAWLSKVFAEIARILHEAQVRRDALLVERPVAEEQ
jgi:hypothetical protein